MVRFYIIILFLILDYHFGYETSNGIRAEEAGDTANAQGGFAYVGDDGHTYTVTYTAGEGGFRPQGEHLPVPPPTPDAILEALKKNEQDEAAGIFDDGNTIVFIDLRTLGRIDLVFFLKRQRSFRLPEEIDHRPCTSTTQKHNLTKELSVNFCDLKIIIVRGLELQ